MKKKYIILSALFIMPFYSNNSSATLSCGAASCTIGFGDILNEKTYTELNGSNPNHFTGNDLIRVSGDLSNITIDGLYYSKFDVNVNYSKENPFKMSLNTPVFYLESPTTKGALLKNSIFMEYDSDLVLENSTIENAIFLPGEKGTFDNTVSNGQIIITDRVLLTDGYFDDRYYIGNTEAKKTKYYGDSSEIIKSDSEVNHNLSSSDSTFNNTSEQYLSGLVFTTNPTFNDNSTQILKNNSSASDVTLNHFSESTVHNSAKQTGTTTVNDFAQLILTTGSEDKTANDAGAYAEKVLLSGEDTKLIIDSGSAGNTAFVDSISGDGSVLLTSKTHGYSDLITDNISGDQSYSFSTDIKNQIGSKLTINNSSSGEHTVFVENNGAVPTNGTEKITIIEDKSGENAKASFTSNETIELGGYAYTVQRDGDTDNWVVIGGDVNTKPTDPAVPSDPTSPQKPTINNTAKSITGLTSSSYLLNQAELTTLRQRMGDLITDKTTSSADISGVWGRVYGGQYKTRDNANLAKLSMNYYGFQLGGDSNTIKEGDNKNYLGAFIGHTTGKPDFHKGDSTVESWYGGLYNTFITEDNFYIDSVFKFGQYRNKYNLNDSQDNSVNGKVKSNVLTLSSEIGKRFILTSNDAYNLYLEPQAQLTWSRIGSFKTGASNRLNVKQNAYNSTIGRLGALFGSQINKQSDVYLKASYLHEFKKNVKYKLNTSEESYNVQGNGVEIGIGGNVKLNENGYLYLEANYINSHAHYTGSKFNAGYRYSF